MKKFILSLMIVFFFGKSGLKAQQPPLPVNTLNPNTTLSSCTPNDTRTLQVNGITASSSVTIFAIKPAALNPGVVPNCAPMAPAPGTDPYLQVTAGGFPVTVVASNILTVIGACSQQIDGIGYLCVYGGSVLAATVSFNYDTTPSNVTISSVSAGNKRIYVTIEDAKSDTSNYNPTYEVCYSKDADTVIADLAGKTTACSKQRKENNSKNIILTDLINGSPAYNLVARVKGSSNQWSPSFSATPAETEGFSKIYDGEPNPLSFSCTQTSAGSGVWVLFLVLGLFLLRKNPPQSLFFKGGSRNFFIIWFLGSLPAFADLGQVNLSITGTPYKPNLNANTTRPFYNNIFHNNLLPLMGIEVDVHLLDDFGSLQIGLGTSYTYASGKALLTTGGGESADSAGLHMLHLRPQLTYILDPWIDIVPLAPYARTGIATVGYMFTYQGGLDKENDRNKPLGFVFGWEAAIGLMIVLDWMEPRVSKAARANGAYEHVYLKVEAAYMPINNFYQKGLDFSPAWPTPDFPLMLNFGLVFEFK